MSRLSVTESDPLQEFFFTSFVGDDNDFIRVAHIKLPLYREPGFESRVITSFPEDSNIFLFVTSTEDVSELSTPNLGRPAITLSFVDFLKLLTVSRKPNPESDDAWDMSLSGTEAIEANILPRNASVLFMIDSSMPADCALALHGVLQWALDTFRYPDTSIRILTMSTADHGTLVSNLVRLKDSEFELPSLDLSLGNEIPQDIQTLAYDDDEAIVTDICDALMKNAGASQLVISFRDNDNFNSMLYDGMEKAKGGMVKQAEVANRMGQHSRFHNIKDSTTQGVAFHLCLPGDFALVPPAFNNFELICVVLDGCLPKCQAWHHDTRQVVGFDRCASNQQRWQQLWWSHQETTERRIYTRNESLDDFLNGGHRHHQVVEDTHLGGFIASMYDRASWGIDILRTLDCFIAYPARMDQTTMRLETQGILSKGQFGLEGSEADAFRAILPLVDYDYRLALFGCLDSNPVVRGVKLELISVLTMGIHNIVTVKDRSFLKTLLEDDELFQKFFSACMGPSRSLASSGGMWLALGLWKRYSLDDLTVNSTPQQEETSTWLGNYLQPLEESVENVKGLVRALYKALKGIDVAAQDMKGHLDYELNESEQFKIHTHMFHAYMFQLTLVRQGQEHVTYLLYPAMMDVVKARGILNLNLLIDEPTFLRSDQAACTLGISHSLVRSGEKIFLADWTWIPLRVAALWIVDNAPDSDFTSMLLDTTEDVKENIDEM